MPVRRPLAAVTHEMLTGQRPSFPRDTGLAETRFLNTQRHKAAAHNQHPGSLGRGEDLFDEHDQERARPATWAMEQGEHLQELDPEKTDYNPSHKCLSRIRDEASWSIPR